MSDDLGQAQEESARQRSSVAGVLGRVVLSALLSAICLPSGVVIGARLHLTAAFFLLLPGVVFARILSRITGPVIHADGGWFSGLAQPMLYTALGDWLLYAVLFYVVFTWRARRRAS